MNNNSKPTVPVIVGSTCSGKTELSIRVARKCSGEIVSADSRQIYRFMNIGTAKPSKDMLSEIPHHMIDILEPGEDFSAGEYAQQAREIVLDIFRRNHQPLVVGGSGLYIQALMEGVFLGKYRNDHVREKLKNEVKEKGLSELYERLKQIDPTAGKRIHGNDEKRILRALEVYEISGITISRVQQEQTSSPPFAGEYWGLLWTKEALRIRIDDRVDNMMEEGLLSEVEGFWKMHYRLDEKNSMDAVGYKELFSYLEGKITLSEAVKQIKDNTRKLAKKQMTWFRRITKIKWIELKEPVEWEEIARQIVQSVTGSKA